MPPSLKDGEVVCVSRKYIEVGDIEELGLCVRVGVSVLYFFNLILKPSIRITAQVCFPMEVTF